MDATGVGVVDDRPSVLTQTVGDFNVSRERRRRGIELFDPRR
jgi:hypothetical protein